MSIEYIQGCRSRENTANSVVYYGLKDNIGLVVDSNWVSIDNTSLECLL